METAPEELRLLVVHALVRLTVHVLHQELVLHVHTEVQPLHQFTVTVRPLPAHMAQAVLHEAQQDLRVDTQVLDQHRVAHAVSARAVHKVEALVVVAPEASETFVAVHVSTYQNL